MGDDEKREKRERARERERDETSRLKYRVHVRSEHRDVGTSPVETFIPPLAGLIIYASSLARFIVGITINEWSLVWLGAYRVRGSM